MVVFVFVAGTLVGSAWINADKAKSDSESPKTIANAENSNVESYAYWDSEKATIELFENAAPSVAYITTASIQRNYWTRNAYEVPSGSGSGFVWDDRGHVVTNYHVIQGASTVNVVLNDQSSHEAEVIGTDETKT